jgi:hypothetical protein
MTPRKRLLAVVLPLALALSACGDGHHYDSGPPPVAGLGLTLTRIGPDAVQLDWSFDPVAVAYDVVRDGYPLARVGATTLVDASVIGGYRYCYQVTGRGASGAVVSITSVGCITAF